MTRLEIPGPLGQRRRLHLRVWLQRLLWPLMRLLANLLPRLFDLLIALALLLALAPLLLLRAGFSLIQTRRVFDQNPRIGQLRRPFRSLRFSGRGPLRGAAVWLNVLRGDMAVVGPRALSAEEAAAVPVRDQIRFAVRPGLVSPFGLRSRIGIAHLSEYTLDREFVYGQSLEGDLGLAARSMVTSVIGGRSEAARPAPARLNFFGVPVVNTTMVEAVEWVITAAETRRPGIALRQMAFVNPDCLNIAWAHPEYHRALQQAERVLPDGIGIHLGCRMRGQTLRENVNGTDLFPLLCEAASRTSHSLYLLGARPGIAAAAAEQIQRRFPALMIAGTQDGYFDTAEERAVVDAINASGADILLVAFGAPRQELWIAHHREQLQVGVAFGVGGLLDFYSGRIPRAPVWMRELGIEWVYRLAQEPGRMWRRYLIGNPLFLFRVWQQMLSPERFALPARDDGAKRSECGSNPSPPKTH